MVQEQIVRQSTPNSLYIMEQNQLIDSQPFKPLLGSGHFSGTFQPEKLQNFTGSFEEIMPLMQSLSQIEMEFKLNLARVYDKGSFNSGTTECYRLIDENCDMANTASVFLKALMEKSSNMIAKETNNF